MNPPEIHGAVLAMIAWGKSADGEDEVVVYYGTANWTGRELLLQRDDASSMVVMPEWYERISPVSDVLRETFLRADYCFSVTIGPLPEKADESEYLKDRAKVARIRDQVAAALQPTTLGCSCAREPDTGDAEHWTQNWLTLLSVQSRLLWELSELSVSWPATSPSQHFRIQICS